MTTKMIDMSELSKQEALSTVEEAIDGLEDWVPVTLTAGTLRALIADS